MRKFSISLLLLLVAGMQSVFAQETTEAVAEEAVANEEATPETTTEKEVAAGKDITLKVTPSAYGFGRIYLAGTEFDGGQNLATDGDAEARLTLEADYGGIAGVKIELEGDLNANESVSFGGSTGGFVASNEDAAYFGFGSNAYAYGHILEVFGINKKKFDVYLQTGRFELEISNIGEVADDEYLYNMSDALQRTALFNKKGTGTSGIAAALRGERYNKLNGQLDIKILDMLTVRYGVSFTPFGSVNDGDDNMGHDMAWGLLFDKTFGAHQIKAYASYVVDFTDNEAGVQKDGTTTKYPSKATRDFDQLGFGVSYIGTFGRIKLSPYFLMRFDGAIAKPRNSFVNPMINWSGGVKFQLMDEASKYDMIGVGVDLGGQHRENSNYKAPAGTPGNAQNIVEVPFIANTGFSGIGFKVWTDALQGVLGKNYLHFYLKGRLDFADPIDAPGLPDRIERKGFLGKFGVGLEQYLVNVDNAKVKLIAAFTMENIAPYLRDGVGYISDLDATTTVAISPFKVYVDVGIDATLTIGHKITVK